MYEKLLNACMLHSAAVQEPDSALGCPGGKDACVGLPAAPRASWTQGQLFSLNAALQLCMFSTCVMTVL